MNDKDNLRIYIAPKRGRLPRKYEFIGEPHPWATGWRWRLLYLLILSLLAAFLWWIRR